MYYMDADNDSGGAIGAGLFVGTGGAFQTGGPAAVFLGFIIIGLNMYVTKGSWISAF